MCLPVSEIVLTELIGHGPAVMVPCEDLGPTNVSLSIPPAVILYSVLQLSPLTTTVANPFFIGALPIIKSKINCALKVIYSVHVKFNLAVKSKVCNYSSFVVHTYACTLAIQYYKHV